MESLLRKFDRKKDQLFLSCQKVLNDRNDTRVRTRVNGCTVSIGELGVEKTLNPKQWGWTQIALLLP